MTEEINLKHSLHLSLIHIIRIGEWCGLIELLKRMASAIQMCVVMERNEVIKK